MPTKYSPSRLSVYQTCPRQYFFQYVRKLPRRAWANQSFGVSLHRTLHQLHESGGPQEQTLDKALNQLDASWTSAGYASAEEEALARERGKELLAKYYETWSIQEGTPILLEKRLSAPYQDIHLMGIIDRVDRHPDGSLEIIDYKSGYAPETVSLTTVQQLSIYHHLIASRLGEAPVRHSIHYLASDVRISLTLADRAEEILEAVRATVRRLESDEQYQPVADSHCNWCDYQRFCPEGRNRPLA